MNVAGRISSGNGSGLRIAVIGAGIAGLGCAWLLSRHHHVTLYEAEDRLGGHSHTVDVRVGGRDIAVDTGFIVYNDTNYPNLLPFFELLDVPTEKSDMSFSLSLDGGRFEYASPLPWGPFVQPANLLSPKFLRMLADIVRFYRHALAAQKAGIDSEMSVGDLLAQGGYGRTYRFEHLLPMASAIWSTPVAKVLEFEARGFVRFYDEHGLLRFRNRPRWRTVTGGSREYVGRVAAGVSGPVRTAAAVRSVRRLPDGVRVLTDGDEARFDQVVLATHADRSLAILGEGASAAERQVLGAFEYEANELYLHGDRMHMPRRRGAWASWNFHARTDADPARKVPVTYWMNRLQNIDRRYPLFVSLNPWTAPLRDLQYGRFRYDHPVFSRATAAAQVALSDIQGVRRTWFCGAWCGFGFHEDGFKSGIRVARALGADVPWPAVDAEPFSLAPAEAAA